jgi:hypothetical protein
MRMPFWQHAATFFAFMVIAAIIVFAGRHHEAVSLPGDIKVVVVEK